MITRQIKTHLNVHKITLQCHVIYWPR